MSIILKGIDLPKDAEYFSIVFYKKKSYRKEKIMDISEAIQIPKGHGRLIDGDELKEKYSNWLEAVPFVNNSLADMGRRDVLISVNHDLTYSAPTILDKERE